jgi:hypothetical protein
VDEILEHLEGDQPALRACSLTCKALLRSSRPIIHRRLYVVSRGIPGSTDEHQLQTSNPPRLFVLSAAAKHGLAHYTRELTINLRGGFKPADLREILPQFRAFTRLTSLTVYNFTPTPFLLVFEQYFGHLAQQIQSLEFKYPSGFRDDLFYFISQFPNLDNLKFYSFPRNHLFLGAGSLPIRSSPTLRGTLQVGSMTIGGDDFLGCLTRFPSGLSFRSIEFYRCTGIDPNILIRECSSTLQHLTHITHISEFPTHVKLVRTSDPSQPTGCPGLTCRFAHNSESSKFASGLHPSVFTRS